VTKTKVQTAQCTGTTAKWQYTGNDYSDLEVRKTVSVTRIPEVHFSALPTFKLNLDWKKCIDLVIIGRNLVSSIKGNRKFLPR
jgi:hypothetical protein